MQTNYLLHRCLLTMSWERPSAIKLPSIYLGCHRIRYLYLAKSGNIYVPDVDDLTSKTHTQGELIPMFLASDALSGITQLPKNYPRVHSRYSKQGMATKLKLSGLGDRQAISRFVRLVCQGLCRYAHIGEGYPKSTVTELHVLHDSESSSDHRKVYGDFFGRLDDIPPEKCHRISDIANSQEVWFYSIQGLFQAVFEYHSRAVVRDCLMSLRELWIQRFEDDPLPADTDVRSVIMDSSCDRLFEQVCSHGTSSDCGAVQIPESLPQETVYSNSSTASVRSQIPRDSQIQQDLRNVYKLGDIQRQLEIILQNVGDTLDDRVELAEQNTLRALKVVLTFCLVCLFTENDTIFPVCLLHSYTNFICHKSDLKSEALKNHFGLNPQKNFVLCALSEWLGREFSALENKISERVASFKQSHIGQIDSLPTPQSIVEQLFPACMSCLLENWMGVYRTRYIADDCDIKARSHQSELSDHNYIHQISQAESDASPEVELGHAVEVSHYPFVQLILEFTNNCLVSGVAHVLYTRLRQGLI